MKVSPHLVGLYNRSVRRYRKLSAQLRRQTNPAGYTYQTILARLRKLRRKIATLQVQLKIATATGVVALSLSISPAEAQMNTGPMVPQTRYQNPLRESFLFEGAAYPTLVDLDKDGDFDLVVGDESNWSIDNQYRTLRYFVNVGTATNPLFEEKFGADNPFADLYVQQDRRAPVFADIDNDGDQDLFVSSSYYSYYNNFTQIQYFRNDNGVFAEQTGSWNPTLKTGNPFDGFDRDNIKLAFSDIDKDGDLDALITGSVYDNQNGNYRYVSYYKNDGKGVFTEANDAVQFTPLPSYENINHPDILNPTFADIDKDGDDDLVLGGYYLGLRYYKQVSPGKFEEQTGTGNPFQDIYEPDTQPALADLDNDGDVDLLLGDGDGDQYYYYFAHILHYFENKGNSVFEEKRDLDNPLSGVNGRQQASALLVDLDDDGDLDALIGHKYDMIYDGYNTPFEYVFEDGKFHRRFEGSRFETISIQGAITPQLADIDGDGDLDFISGSWYGGLLFYRNDNGEYTEITTSSPFQGINMGYRTSPVLADVDGDEDFDLVVSAGAGGPVYYFENTGGKTSPIFKERTGSDNPFSIVGSAFNYQGHLTLSDVDHDGDLDLITSENVDYKYSTSTFVLFYENTGTRTAPVFEYSNSQPYIPEEDPLGFTSVYGLNPHFADVDQDGDLDLFAGDYVGRIRYMKNENPAVVTSVATQAITYLIGVDGDVVIDPTLTLADEDNDFIVQATVTIGNYEEGDELHVASTGNITGSFNSDNGVLTLRGKGTLLEYQTLLQTVYYHRHAESGGRTRPAKKSTTAKAIAFRIFDSDFTTPQVASRTLNVTVNNPPVITSATKTTQLGFNVNVDLAALISDPDDNLDLTSIRIVQQPASGATATIDGDLQLRISYDGLTFTGKDQLTIEVCDDLGECAQNIVTIDVQNDGEIVVFNAVAPNSSGDNRFMRIHNLPEGNKVSIFNRWGDKVFEIENYDGRMPGRRFEGANDSGKMLPTGTYFYKIEIGNNPGYTGPRVVTGYISLKQ